MDIALFDKEGKAVAYIVGDFDETIYLWEGKPAAYVFEDRHIYGFNGRHLGWLINDIIYNKNGERIGFTRNSCPVSPEKEPVKPKRYPKNKIQPRWKANTPHKLLYQYANEDLAHFLSEG